MTSCFCDKVMSHEGQHHHTKVYVIIRHRYSFENTALLTGFDAKGTFIGNKKGGKPVPLESSFQAMVG